MGEPPIQQGELLRLAAAALGSLNENGEPRPQVTARLLGLGPSGTQRISRIKKGEGVLHYDEAWRMLQALGWLNEERIRVDLGLPLASARAAAADALAAAERLQPNGRQEGEGETRRASGNE